MYVLIWILSFLILIILHEAGHFFFAKKFWVKVYEFWLWIPPKIKTLFKDKDWTEYTLNALPLWGFIRPKGENFHSDSEIYDKDSFHSKPLWQKIIILLWWVIANLVIAFVLFTIAFWHWIKPIFIIPDSSNNFTAESYLFPTVSFAQKVGYIQQTSQPLKVEWIVKTPISLTNQIHIQTWDIIQSINWIEVNTSNVSKILKENLWKKVSLVINRSWSILTFSGHCPSDWCLLGIFYNSDQKVQPVKMSFPEAVKNALHEIKAETILTFEWLKLLWKKLTSGHPKQAVENMSGPVGAIAIGKYILKIGIWEYLAFIWSISLALAIFNVLPIPALDWGRILTTLVMHLGKFDPKKYLQIENYINIIFFGLLMLFGFYIMYLDFVRFY